MKNKKISKIANDCFEYVMFFVGIGSAILAYKIFKIFNIADRFSYQLYECPGFFLCFIDYVPIIKISTILKDPVPVIIFLVIFLSIFLPITLIYAYGFEIDYKRKEKEDNN